MTQETQICPKHEKPLVFVPELNQYICKDCAYSSFLTQQSQEAAIRKYNHSEKHKKSEKRYEQTTGKAARERYLKSDKYKQRRREYNQRLAESLRIARQANLERAKAEKPVERKRSEELAELIIDIREFTDVRHTTPSIKNVILWAKNDYNTVITPEQAQDLINKASKRR